MAILESDGMTCVAFSRPSQRFGCTSARNVRDVSPGILAQLQTRVRFRHLVEGGFQPDRMLDSRRHDERNRDRLRTVTDIVSEIARYNNGVACPGPGLTAYFPGPGLSRRGLPIAAALVSGCAACSGRHSVATVHRQEITAKLTVAT